MPKIPPSLIHSMPQIFSLLNISFTCQNSPGYNKWSSKNIGFNVFICSAQLTNTKHLYSSCQKCKDAQDFPASANVELSANEWREVAFIMFNCTKHVQVNYTSQRRYWPVVKRRSPSIRTPSNVSMKHVHFHSVSLLFYVCSTFEEKIKGVKTLKERVNWIWIWIESECL